MDFKTFIKELNGNRVEGELIKTIFYSFLTSIITLIILYWVSFKNIENFIPRYGLYLFLATIGFALMMPVIRQVRAYKEFMCMPGMMVGMTIGMLSGFLPGYFIGATNGMFIGSLAGIGIGMYLGIKLGSSCGIMGIMEGMMSGFMGGLMGAMTAVMMFNDNIKLAAIIILIVSAAIMFGLNYMVYKETLETERKVKEDYFHVVVTTFILIILTIVITVFGPRSLLFQ
jgi:hypothetical protein